ncbi:hypothetical protein IQ268_31640 [Oculatella sp. LEGE 06141]|uniref:hypothetical protein n=1 Tax=Oculatella sp. LEGE 06141 TaxID=1828648 RepID=UPI001880B050|nr:hypothetical protein [Oculatella sp. LEGE 06141]MBE9183090.1 hypothetical protein [Oculatella sp. LEGE 06141]
MSFSKQTIALVTLVTTLSTGLSLAPNSATAQVVRQGRSDRAPATPSVHPQRPLRLTAPQTLSGTWQGNMHAAGDDALSYLTLQMTGGGSSYQGTWQLEGQDEILQAGTLSASKQGNTITISLEQFNGNQAIVLTGIVNANGTTLSGQVVNSTFVFYFTKN